MGGSIVMLEKRRNEEKRTPTLSTLPRTKPSALWLLFPYKSPWWGGKMPQLAKALLAKPHGSGSALGPGTGLADKKMLFRDAMSPKLSDC